MATGATIRVFSAEEIAARAGGEAPFLRWPEGPTLFAERAMRLRQLAAGHPMGDYLGFASGLALAQQRAYAAFGEPPLPAAGEVARAHTMEVPPLSARDWPRPAAWRDAVRRIAAELRADAPEGARAVLEGLRAASDDVLEAQADALLERTATGLDLAAAPIVAAALQVCWTRLLLGLRERTGTAGEAVTRLPDASACPACGSPPVASVVRSDGGLQGQRYLHCSLCSLQWHLPRLKCPHCLAEGKLVFHALDRADASDEDGGARAAQATVQAETCEHCDHYLKMLHADRDPQVEPVADDLASVALDLLVAETGADRHGVNYLLLFGEPPGGTDGDAP